MKRDIAIDYIRSGVTMLVVGHHAALAYNTFSYYNPSHYVKSTAPVVDTVRFAPLDCLVGWNDLFFMSLMFLISGLFVAPSIKRKGPGQFLTDRTKRLGIPFVIASTLLIPIAYYPSWLLSRSVSQGGFLGRFFTIDGWSPGPLWFVLVLLGFCVVVAIISRFIPNLMTRLFWS
ncbi:MAG: acyltransferase, partial [Syntrophorhabdus sp.]